MVRIRRVLDSLTYGPDSLSWGKEKIKNCMRVLVSWEGA